jgi:glucose-1-phosphate cytidylyltransferase
MKVIILAGGLGTRIAEESAVRPKPMVEIGGKPILWHIMKIYGHYGFNEFVICLGYKGIVIKEYFSHYFLHTSDVTFDMTIGNMTVHRQAAEPWQVSLVDTGDNSQTGGRLKRALEFIGPQDDFVAMTYGDGVTDLAIPDVVKFHRTHGKMATVTAVRPAKRFGALALEGDRVTTFKEKPENDGGWINGGFFLLSPKVKDLIKDDDTIWEREPLEALATQDQLRAFIHPGFWHPMDTLRDKQFLEEQWAGQAPWRKW